MQNLNNIDCGYGYIDFNYDKNNLEIIDKNENDLGYIYEIKYNPQKNVKDATVNHFKLNDQKNHKPIIQRKSIAALSNHYQRTEVEQRIKKKIGNQYSQIDFSKMIDRANKLTAFVLADQSDLTGQQKSILKSELKHKHPHLSTSQELQNALAGKILSLAIKTEHLFNQSPLNFTLPSQVQSTKGRWKPAPFNRLLNDTLPFKTALGTFSNGMSNHLIGIKFLGQGAFNSAQTVYDMERGEVFVYRYLQPHVMSKPKSLKQWEQETFYHYQLLQNQVPGLVNIHEIFNLNANDPNTASLIPSLRALLLEKCDGDLSVFKDGKLAPKEQTSMIVQIATTINSMHRCGFTHGDLKPQNVFYKGREAKVGDLGTIRKTGERKYVDGDRYYQGPEAYWYDVKNPIRDQGADYFSLGLIAYELKYGEDFISHFSNIINMGDFLNLSRRMSFHKDCFDGLRNLADLTCPLHVRDQALMQLKNTRYTPKQLAKIAQIMSENGMLSSNHSFYQLINKHGQNAILGGISQQGEIDSYIHNELVANFIYPQYHFFYQYIKEDLENSSDPMNTAILGLLNPNVHQRWTAAQAAQYLSNVA